MAECRQCRREQSRPDQVFGDGKQANCQLTKNWLSLVKTLTPRSWCRHVERISHISRVLRSRAAKI
ncbi:hypothetical protein SK128_005525, partial [Halocaridina rubra]